MKKNYFGIYGYFIDVYQWHGDQSGQGIYGDGTEGRNIWGEDPGHGH